jgi:hypothetical protein
VQLRLDRRDRLADVARLELGQLGTVADDRVGKSVEQAGSLRRRRLRPGAVERATRRGDRPVDIGLPGHGRAAERLARSRLEQLANLAGLRLDQLAADEQPVLTSGRDRHGLDDTAVAHGHEP